MVRSNDHGFTPVKIRGKRSATPAEKWHTGKRRKPELQQRRSHMSTSTSATSTSGSRKRLRRVGEEDSPLEMLPAEVVQSIFEYSLNIDLPLVSRQLAAKLSKSTHLENKLTDALLSPVLRLLGGEDASAMQLAAATRLLNSRFMAFAFFTAWLQSHTSAVPDQSVHGARDQNDWCAMWAALQPSPNLLPPRKLLSPPFTEDKSSFLAVLAQEMPDIATLDPAYGEFARHGLQLAVAQGQRDVVALMLKMGLSVSTELLRVAIIDPICNKEIVLMLLDSSVSTGESLSRHEGIDLLDPALWSWADKARKDGNEKGRWLVELLRDSQQRKSVSEDF